MSVLTITGENFETEVMQSKIPVLIDFWAAWCGPCRMVGPIVEEVAQETNGSVKVCKVNVDEEPGLAQEFNVMSIPTLVVIKDGKVEHTSVGVKQKAQILEMVK